VDWNSAPIAWLSGSRGADAGDNAGDNGRATRSAGTSKIQAENQHSLDGSGGTYGIAVGAVEVTPDLAIEPVIKRDPDDDKILACAVAAQAEWLISGDDHLLSVKRYKGITIVTPSQFSRIWEKSQ